MLRTDGNRLLHKAAFVVSVLDQGDMFSGLHQDTNGNDSNDGGDENCDK